MSEYFKQSRCWLLPQALTKTVESLHLKDAQPALFFKLYSKSDLKKKKKLEIYLVAEYFDFKV